MCPGSKRGAGPGFGGPVAGCRGPAVAADYKQFVLDLAGLTFADCCGARTLAALVQAVPGKCPVIVRSVPPAVRRVLDYTGILLDRMPRQKPVIAEGRPVPLAQDMQIALSPAEATRSGAPPRLSPGQGRQAGTRSPKYMHRPSRHA